MDQGLAALLGAAVGVAGTSMAAAITSRASRRQAETELAGSHAQWRRQIRRDAYVCALEAVGAAQQRLDASTQRLWEEGTQTEPLVSDTAETVENNVRPALRIVQLEGPTLVSEAARTLWASWASVVDGLESWDLSYRTGDGPLEARRDFTLGAMRDVMHATDAFENAVVEVLNEPLKLRPE
ncbi:MULTISPECIES: hypothetical protein [unclassified Streptomyces]|uniref:hypothetical protein n=1 Tax=unclassified Streptomyces TaxID=2593676 RepID=UPI0033FBA46E